MHELCKTCSCTSATGARDEYSIYRRIAFVLTCLTWLWVTVLMTRPLFHLLTVIFLFCLVCSLLGTAGCIKSTTRPNRKCSDMERGKPFTAGKEASVNSYYWEIISTHEAGIHRSGKAKNWKEPQTWGNSDKRRH